MKIIRPSLFLAIVASLSACGASTAPKTEPPVQNDAVDVTIASVTLADDCGTAPTAIPEEPAASMDQPMGDMAGGYASSSQASGKRMCIQSSIQLRVANGTDAPSKVVVQKVELVDESGEVIGELTTHDPSRWDDDAYHAWDEQVAPSETLQVSYALSAAGVSRGATYTVRVTVAAGADERTLEQPVTLEAEGSMPPDAVT
jgi:hypothetical protein